MIDTTTYTQTADSLGVSLNALFGESARLLPQLSEIPEADPSIAENWVVWGMAVALFLLYLFVMFAYGSHVGQMGKIAFGRNLGIRVADEMSYLFMRAVRYALLVGIVMWSLVAVGWLEVAGVKSLGTNPLWLAPLFMAVALTVGLLQRALTNGMCLLVRRRDIAEGLNVLADTLMALAAIVTTPVALLFVANTGTSAEVLGWVAAGVAVLALAVFCTKSLIFFIEQKVSILLLILYLCTAILIPIGIVVTLVVRNSAI